MRVNAFTGQAGTSGLPLFARRSDGTAGAAAMVPSRPVSRRGQPTSRASEKRLRSSGVLGDQCAATLAALEAYIAHHGMDPTTAELAHGDAALVHQYGRRLSDLRTMGRVTNPRTAICRVTGRRSLTWRPA